MTLRVEDLRDILTPDGVSVVFELLGDDLYGLFDALALERLVLRFHRSSAQDQQRLAREIEALILEWATEAGPELRRNAAPISAATLDGLDRLYDVDATDEIGAVAAITALASRGVAVRARNTAPSLGERIAKVVSAMVYVGASLPDVQNYAAGRLRQYSGIVGSAYVGRARSAALVGGMAAVGVERLRFVAFLDHRTTDICEYMNERVMVTDAAARVLERAADASDEDVLYETPWVRKQGNDLVVNRPGETVVVATLSSTPGERFSSGLSTNELVEVGLVLPPLHGHCRSHVIPV